MKEEDSEMQFTNPTEQATIVSIEIEHNYFNNPVLGNKIMKYFNGGNYEPIFLQQKTNTIYSLNMVSNKKIRHSFKSDIIWTSWNREDYKFQNEFFENFNC
jgi:hypothetical protein